MRFEDSRYLLSPYRVLTQETIYHFNKEDILHYTDLPDSKIERRGIKYGPFKNVAPFEFDLIHLSLRMPNP